MKASLVRSGLSALVAALLLVGAAAAQQSAPQGAGALADVAGMELLPVLQRATDAGPADPGQPLVVAVSLPFARPSDVQAFADEVSDPDSPRYRQFLTPEEVGNRFGLPLSRVGEIEDYLRLHGFTITGTGGNRLAVVARGTVGQAEQAFHTTIRKWTAAPQHAIEPAEFIAPSTPVRLPAALADSVIDVCGLDTFTRPLPLATLLTPALARSLYDTKPIYDAGMTGAGRTIGISSFDGFRESNWLLFISHFALPVPAGGPGSNVTDVLVGGGGTGAGGAGGEGDLDIQMALGQAPLADIRIYDSPSKSNLIAVLSAEANDNLCDVITESYGWQLPTGTANSAHNQHLSMTAQGITYMAASGDFGTTIEPFSYPDYDPEVLSVGGTIANVNVTTGARVTEKNWTGGGSGWSNKALAFNVRPSWQTGVGVPAINAENDRRLVPDVAFHSSGNSGAYQFYVNNGLNAGIGTSFASPVFAGQLQLISQKVIALGGLQPDGSGKRRFGRMQDLIYAQNNDPAIWFDITTGNSNGPLPSDQGLATPHVGWDSCVGWGPMNCDAFASAVVCATGGCGDVGWTDLGFALAGINGLPALTAAGPMTAGSETS
ncbi:MAG TPA: protease pro-enzyme activation domain-containing protein, partial [Planctomycetota bacterium]|nr:protease pro-enzyme activation domain-containing protein [Planctomycetota bacterium]